MKELTEDQKAKLPEYRDRWIKIGLDTTPITESEKEIVVALMNKLYTNVGLIPPKEKVFLPSPLACLQAYADKVGCDIKSASDEISNFCYGQHEAGWLSFYDFFINETEVVGLEPIKPQIELSKYVNWYLPYEDIVFISAKPVFLRLNQDNKLDNSFGAAIRYGDGFSVFCINGETPEESTLKQLKKIEELRKTTVGAKILY